MLDRDLFEQTGQEIVAALAERIRPRGLMLADFPRLTTEREGFQRRMTAVMTGQGKGRVNLPSTIKKFVHCHHPDFTLSAKIGDNYSYEKAFSPGFKILLIFERFHYYGLGKAFTLHLGCECVLNRERLRWKHSLFSFFDRERMGWIYGQRDELEACLEEAQTLLSLVLPEYEAAWLSLCEKENSEILRTRPQHGPLSFQEAADIAFGTLSSVFPQFQRIDGAWFRRENSPYSYFGFQPRANSATASGRLSSGHSWHVRFADVEVNRTVIVCIPYCGKIGFVLSGTMMLNRNNVHHILEAVPLPQEPLMLPVSASARPVEMRGRPAWREFVDSPDIMEIAANAGGAEFLKNYPNCPIGLQLNAETSDPPVRAEYWWVDYFPWKSKNDARLAFNISARNGSITYRDPPLPRV